MIYFIAFIVSFGLLIVLGQMIEDYNQPRNSKGQFRAKTPSYYRKTTYYVTDLPLSR